MAQSSWASGLQVSRWAKQLWYEAGKDVTFGLLMNPSGTGISGDDTLEGNEEQLKTYSQTVTLGRERNAFRDTGKFDNKKVLHNFREEALASLKIWLSEKVDSDQFSALGTSMTRTFRADDGGVAVYTRLNQASITAQLVAADLIVPGDISALKKAAKTPKGSDEVKIRPIKIKGEEWYVLLVHPEQAYDLIRNSEWQQAQREAGIRGRDNPIFTGAIGAWDKVVVHEHELITRSDSYGSNSDIHGAQALFLGAQAGTFATGGEPIWVEKTFDYGNQLGVAGGLIYTCDKATFNSEDFGVIAYYTACTQMSAV